MPSTLPNAFASVAAYHSQYGTVNGPAPIVLVRISLTYSSVVHLNWSRCNHYWLAPNTYEPHPAAISEPFHFTEWTGLDSCIDSLFLHRVQQRFRKPNVADGGETKARKWMGKRSHVDNFDTLKFTDLETSARCECDNTYIAYFGPIIINRSGKLLNCIWKDCMDSFHQMTVFTGHDNLRAPFASFESFEVCGCQWLSSRRWHTWRIKVLWARYGWNASNVGCSFSKADSSPSPSLLFRPQTRAKARKIKQWTHRPERWREWKPGRKKCRIFPRLDRIYGPLIRGTPPSVPKWGLCPEVTGGMNGARERVHVCSQMHRRTKVIERE